MLMPRVKIGDSVLWHLIPIHLCQHEDPKVAALHKREEDGACRCLETASVSRPAIVLHAFETCGAPHNTKDDEARCEDCAHVARVRPLRLQVTLELAELALGYNPIQSQSPMATGLPPASGSWTPGSSRV